MLRIEKWKIILTLLIAFWGVIYAVPSSLSEENLAKWRAIAPSWMPSSTVSLGLDLQGGSHLLLEVNTKATIKERLDSLVDAARTELRKENIGYTDLGVDQGNVAFTLRDVAADRDAAYKIARGLDSGVDINIADDGRVTVAYTEAAITEIKSQVIAHSIEIIRRRVDETGTKEPIIQRQGEDRIILQLPGVEDPEHVKRMLGKTAKMTFHLVDEEAIPVAGKVPPGSKLLFMKEDETDQPSPAGRRPQIAIKKRVMVSGEMLVDSQPTFDRGMPVVSFRFDSIGAKRFCEVTRENVGKLFAIVLDDEVISAPRINEAICGGSGIISGSFTPQGATELALLLRAGALPAPLNVVEERSVGPSLGADSIEAGKVASIVSLALVMVYMLACYGLFGMYANIALLFNMSLIFACFTLLGSTLTMPGIAGIVLTIGMAVDANVLIFERIREETRAGRSPMSAVDTGYSQAIATIIDSNLTTLIAAGLLFMFGSGPIKGFGVALTIGIVTSMFTAIMLTRLMVVVWLRRNKPQMLHL